MGHQIIRQPGGLYAVFSTGTDRWIRWDQTRDDLIEWSADRAAKDARESMARLLDEVDQGPEYAYTRTFALTFAKANAKSMLSGGQVLDGPVDGGVLEESRIQDAEMTP